MFDLISIGSISVDFYFKGKTLTNDNERFHLAIGGKYQADFFYQSLGGGAANVAIGCSNHGLKTAVMGTIGKNIFEGFIKDQLKQKKVSYQFCDFVENYYNVSAILLSKTGERSIVHYSTFNQKLFDHGIKISNLKKAKIVYLGNLPEIDLSEKIRLSHFNQRNAITTILNLGVKDCRRPKNQLKELLLLVDILIINGHEFAELVKAKYEDIFFNENIINHYIPFLKDKIVVVTEGKRGSFSYYKGKIFHVPAKKVEKIIDTTGAGDAFTAGFIAGFLKTNDLKISMEKGASYAAEILQKIGAN
ncbi:MAG: carbohydrate kinase family protein [Microgenomates group bacterium]